MSELEAFYRARSKANGEMFARFVEERGLDADADWPERDVVDFRALVIQFDAEWSRKRPKG